MQLFYLFIFFLQKIYAMNTVDTLYSNNGSFYMYAQKLLLKDDTDKQGTGTSEANKFQLRMVWIWRSYNTDLYVHKDSIYSVPVTFNSTCQCKFTPY